MKNTIYVVGIAVTGLNKVGKTIKESNVFILPNENNVDVVDIWESPVENLMYELTVYDMNMHGKDPLLSDAAIEHFGANTLPYLDKKWIRDNDFCILIS